MYVLQVSGNRVLGGNVNTNSSLIIIIIIIRWRKQGGYDGPVVKDTGNAYRILVEKTLRRKKVAENLNISGAMLQAWITGTYPVSAPCAKTSFVTQSTVFRPFFFVRVAHN
jgi:hypothetical protein